MWSLSIIRALFFSMSSSTAECASALYEAIPSSPFAAVATSFSAPAAPAAAAPAAAAPAVAAASSQPSDNAPVKTAASVQAAFAAGDAGASRALHDAPPPGIGLGAKEDHGRFGSAYVKSIVFGGLDGVITTFSTIASTFGGDQSVELAIILALANLIADALAMGVGDWFSSAAEFQHALAEKKREGWEFDNLPAGERAEMVEKLIKDKAFAADDAERIIGVIGAPAHRDFFVDFMLHEELGLEAPDDPYAAVKDGATTFASFLLFGAVPLVVYVICWAAGVAEQAAIFGIACAFTFITLFVLGMLQGAITRLNIWRSGAYMAAIGSLATAAAFLVGWGLSKAITNSC